MKFVYILKELNSDYNDGYSWEIIGVYGNPYTAEADKAKRKSQENVGFLKIEVHEIVGGFDFNPNNVATISPSDAGTSQL